MRSIENRHTVSGGMRVLVCSGLLAVVLASAGCSGPSRITVTGIRPASDRMAESEPAADSAYASADAESVGGGRAGSGSVQTKDASAAAVPDAASADTGQIAVYVCGAVKAPGVYYLAQGARICDALDAAGGYTKDADSEWLNQAKALTDGEMLIACTKEETMKMRSLGLEQGASPDLPGSDRAVPDAGTAEGSPGKEALINLNTATKEQLMTLPGIGEAKADAIIRYRTETGFFASAEDVMNISGIKTSIYEKIRDRITTG